jgi:threonine dehydrogenase-like Zn-dependent dehydrogenase
LVRSLGATYHTGTVATIGFEPDIIVECTGVGSVISDSLRHIGSGGVVCLTGLGSGGHARGLPIADLATEVDLKNNVAVGSVNANKRQWYKAGEALARADRSWLSHLVTRREPPENLSRALQRTVDDIKVVIQFSEA